MKTPSALLAGICSLFLALHAPAQAKIEKAEALPALLKDAETDSIQYIERRAAFLFHQKINEYRLSKSIAALEWDDTLWLASRNHNLWMLKNDKLSHDETKGTPAFTAASPGGRYLYVTSDKGKTQWSGENALYNYSAWGSSAIEIAERIAQASFNQWKASPGHNENMLNPDSYMHGVAFNIDGGTAWATDLFARKPYDRGYKVVALKAPMPSKFTTTAAPSNQVVYTNSPDVQAMPSKKRMSNSQYEKAITAKLEEALFPEAVKTEKALATAAKNHVAYMSLHETTNGTEKKGKSRYTGATAKKRVKKASHGFDIFKRMRSTVVEYVFSKSYEAEGFDSEMAIKDAKEQFLNERKDVKGKIKSNGMAVQVRKVKTSYTVNIVVLERRKKGTDEAGTQEATIDF